MRTLFISLACAASLLSAQPVFAVPVSRIAAVVNGDMITVRELDKALQSELIAQKLDPAKNPQMAAEVRKAVLDKMINDKILLQEAEKEKIDVSDADVDAALDRIIKDSQLSRDVFFKQLEKEGYALCIVDSGADHADLTAEYAAIPQEMKTVAAFFGKEVLSQVEEQEILENLPALRQAAGDRAVLRALHFFADDRRVGQESRALESGDFDDFLHLVKESGRSSWMYLQNINPAGAVKHQEMAVALAAAEAALKGRGACRVHGGGFAGTIQAFVPLDLLDSFKEQMERMLGEGRCHVLSIRPEGGAVVWA